MSEPMVLESLEQLKPFLNKDNVLEIVTRGMRSKYQTFQKAVLSDVPQSKEKELVEKAIHSLNKNTKLSEKNLSLVRNVAQLQQLDLVLNGLNLCATSAGFAIMYAKLDSMSAEINQQINQLGSVVKKGHDVQTGYEFKKVLSDYQDMLDSRRRQQPYSEEKMRGLVDRVYNVLSLLISVLQKGISSDCKTLITSIFSLLSMLTVSLRYFDELYYFNNYKVLGGAGAWHSAHDKWMGVFDTLSSEWFVEKLQDYGTFEAKLNTIDVDVYYISLIDQVMELRQEVEDNQELISSIGDLKVLQAFREYSDREVKETIEAAFREAFEGIDDPSAVEIQKNALEQVALL
jgi:hypothetical protein